MRVRDVDILRRQPYYIKCFWCQYALVGGTEKDVVEQASREGWERTGGRTYCYGHRSDTSIIKEIRDGEILYGGGMKRG